MDVDCALLKRRLSTTAVPWQLQTAAAPQPASVRGRINGVRGWCPHQRQPATPRVHATATPRLLCEATVHDHDPPQRVPRG
eukprot:3988537-Prymnesium_polylepis.1